MGLDFPLWIPVSKRNIVGKDRETYRERCETRKNNERLRPCKAWQARSPARTVAPKRFYGVNTIDNITKKGGTGRKTKGILCIKTSVLWSKRDPKKESIIKDKENPKDSLWKKHPSHLLLFLQAGGKRNLTPIPKKTNSWREVQSHHLATQHCVGDGGEVGFLTWR